MASLIEEISATLGTCHGERRKTVTSDTLAATRAFVWVPNPGPQTEAYFSLADETLYGGSAGGGKSDLLLGLGLTEHQRSLILRRVNKDVEGPGGLGERLLEILGSPSGYNAQQHIFTGRGRRIQLGGCEHEKDKQRYKGRAHDLKAFDELADFTESQYLFIITWNRSASPGQRCRTVAATNPPTTPEGQWIVRRWAPWLDPNHPKPARDGELRWFVNINGKDTEVDGPGPHDVGGGKMDLARSRTFVRSRLSDNPDLAATGYAATLAQLPEEERRAYEGGDFTVGLSDDDFQVIPSAWIEAAMQRWQPQPPLVPMTAMAVDIAEGGPDKTVVAYRYGGWYGPIDSEPGKNTREGAAVTAMVVKRRRDLCPVVVDVGGGWGSDAVVHMTGNGIEVVPFAGVKDSMRRTQDGKIKFRNKRAESYWMLREALDPSQPGGSPIALPKDPELKADLAAVRRKPLTPAGLLLEDKREVKKRIGRSPDKGDAVVMCLSEGNAAGERLLRRRRGAGGHLQVNLGFSNLKRRR
jgi:hypothetical protein